MRLFSEKVKYTSTNSSLNILCVEAFEEIFFGVYEIEINKNKYPVEKISEYEGNPVVCIPVVVEGVKRDYPFVLSRGKFEILFNGDNKLNEDYEIVEDTIKDILLETVEEVEETINIPVVVDNRDEILRQIKKAKKDAHKALQLEKAKNLKDIQVETVKKNKLLKNTLDTARENLVDEFVSISKKIREELIDESDNRFSEIRETIDNKIDDLASTLSESLKKDFEQSSKIFDDSIKKLVKESHNSLQPKIDEELKGIATDIVEKVSSIEKELDEKLKDKADKTLIENVEGELSAVSKANIELNDKINKGVNKALSRVGNVDAKVNELTIALSEEVDNKISTAEDNIERYYYEKLSMLEGKTFDLTENVRKSLIELISESKDNLISEIRKIQNEKPIEYIIESKGKREVKGFDSFDKDVDKKIKDRVDNEVTRLRKYISVYSGGGSVAMQFADGGTMNGDLTITGSISASQYLGLPASGGTPAGNNNDLQYNNSGSFGGISSNVTSTPLYLTQRGDGLSASIPSWEPLPQPGTFTYFFHPTSSDVIGYNTILPISYPTLSSITASGVIDGQVLVKYISTPNTTGRNYLPDGQYSCHIHAYKSSGTKDTYIRAELWEVTSTGIDIGLIASLGNSTLLTNISSEFFIAEARGRYDLVDTQSRVALKLYATISGGGSAPTIIIQLGDGADSRLTVPAPIVDASNYVTYTGATGDVNLGNYDISATDAVFVNLSANTFNISGDINFSDIGDGIVIKSPNNSRWRITISDTGALISTSI